MMCCARPTEGKQTCRPAVFTVAPLDILVQRVIATASCYSANGTPFIYLSTQAARSFLCTYVNHRQSHSIAFDSYFWPFIDCSIYRFPLSGFRRVRTFFGSMSRFHSQLFSADIDHHGINEVTTVMTEHDMQLAPPLVLPSEP